MGILEKFESLEYGPAPEDSKEAVAWLERNGRRFCHFVGGKWVEPAQGERLETADPATGEALASVAHGTAEDGDGAGGGGRVGRSRSPSAPPPAEPTSPATPMTAITSASCDGVASISKAARPQMPTKNVPSAPAADSSLANASRRISRRVGPLLHGVAPSRRPAPPAAALAPQAVDPLVREALAAVPVPLADGHVVRGPRGVVLVDAAGQPGSETAAALVTLGIRTVHPDAAHPLLERLADGLGVRDRVRFLGHRDDVPALAALAREG